MTFSYLVSLLVDVCTDNSFVNSLKVTGIKICM